MTKYDPARSHRIIKSLARRGRTNEQIAKELGIRRETLFDWSKKHPEVSNALKDGRAIAIATIEESMFARATGVKTTEKKAVKMPDGTTRTEIVEREHPPDAGAAKILLVNWLPEEYSDREKVEHSGKIELPLSNMSDEEVKALARKVLTESD